MGVQCVYKEIIWFVSLSRQFLTDHNKPFPLFYLLQMIAHNAITPTSFLIQSLFHGPPILITTKTWIHSRQTEPNRTEPRAELQTNELKNSNESNITNKWPTTTTTSRKNSFSITINKCKFSINIYAKCLIPYFIFKIHYARSILLCVRASEIAFHFNKHFCLRKFMNFVHMLKICTQSKFQNWI